MFLLFAGHYYHPLGGASDFQGAHESFEDALAAHDDKKYGYNGGWAEIFNTRTLSIEAFFDNGEWKENV